MSCFVELRRARPLLGTFVEVTARARREALVRMGMTRAFDVIAEVQRLMSFHEATSDVSRLNRTAFSRPTRVHAWTWQVLTRAQEFAVASRGAFDVTIAPLLSKWGYLPTHYESDGAGSFRDVILLPGGFVRFARPLSIDLGGIAKGFAVDCAVEALCAEGIDGGIVNAGGDLRAFGDEVEHVHLRDPANPGRAAGVVSLQNRALATSGIYFTTGTHGGMTVSPLIDGRTRRPFLAEISIAVSAPNCLTADALTKIVAARGEGSCSFLQACEAEAVILERGKSPRVFRR